MKLSIETNMGYFGKYLHATLKVGSVIVDLGDGDSMNLKEAESLLQGLKSGCADIERCVEGMRLNEEIDKEKMKGENNG